MPAPKPVTRAIKFRLVVPHGKHDDGAARNILRQLYNVIQDGNAQNSDALLNRLLDPTSLAFVNLPSTFEDFPHAYVMAAELDSLKAESLTLAERLKEQSIPVELVVERGLVHGGNQCNQSQAASPALCAIDQSVYGSID